ncbi:hypothetical protein MKX03_003675 [Papaver bracteatum]|nr:hypothetical protein MKX03_003675 [Papaver bracteatum]
MSTLNQLSPYTSRNLGYLQMVDSIPLLYLKLCHQGAVCLIRMMIITSYMQLNTTRFLKGRPSWNHSVVPLMLNYALSPEHIIDYINISDLRVSLERAFSKWSSVIPVDFTETQDYEHANITIGFYYAAHLHFNAGHTWAIDFSSEKSKDAYDLETTAVHEIGHLQAIMWPYGGAREKHVHLALDDVNGAQALYGKNPNFKLDSPEMASSDQSSSSFGLREIIICLLVVKALFFL